MFGNIQIRDKKIEAFFTILSNLCLNRLDPRSFGSGGECGFNYGRERTRQQMENGLPQFSQWNSSSGGL